MAVGMRVLLVILGCAVRLRETTAQLANLANTSNGTLPGRRPPPRRPNNAGGKVAAQIDVRCRKRKSPKVSAVLVRRYELPRNVRGSVRCASKPTATARKLG